MGFFGYAMAGCGFSLVGAWESFHSCSSMASSRILSDPNLSSPSSCDFQYVRDSNRAHKLLSSPSLLTYASAACLSCIFMINSLISISHASDSNDHIGSPFQFQVFAVASLFLLYSIIGLAPSLFHVAKFPSEIINLVVLFAFVEEFLLFYLQRKDTIGIENRYYDLTLVPISISIFSTILELKTPSKSSSYPRLARGVGLILQGMWFFQMGISFYSSWIASGCKLVEKNRGNFTITCKGHMEYHKGRAIATLLFNCHLALLVSVLVVIYSVVVNRDAESGVAMSYNPIGQEILSSIDEGKFSLESDEDDAIREVGTHKQELEMTANGL